MKDIFSLHSKQMWRLLAEVVKLTDPARSLGPDRTGVGTKIVRAYLCDQLD